MKSSFAQILERMASESAAKMEDKIPQWAGVPGITVPSGLSLEQCSSSATALSKARTAARLAGPRGRIADLTGGLGVDAWAFSAVAEQVLYNEKDPAIFNSVKQNFAALGIKNVVFSNLEVKPGGATALLGEVRPDQIYLDPARRDGTGKKVFLLEDCSPDITALKDELLAICPRIMVKLSPMADINMVCCRLGCVSEIHIVEHGSECKELLCILQKDFTGEPLTILECGDATLEFRQEEEKSAKCFFPSSGEEYRWLFIPGSAAMKAGAFKLLSQRFGLKKLAPSTHLYFCNRKDDALLPFGKFRAVSGIRPLNGAEMRRTGKEFPRCGVTARNIPMTSEALRKKMGSSDGGEAHVYGVEIAWSDAAPGRFLIISNS